MSFVGVMIGYIIFIPLGLFFIYLGTKHKRKVRLMLEKAPIYQAEIVDMNLERVRYTGAGGRVRYAWEYFVTLQFETKEHGVVQHRMNFGEDEDFVKERLGTYVELYYEPSLFPQPKHIRELEMNKNGTRVALPLGIWIILVPIFVPIIMHLTES